MFSEGSQLAAPFVRLRANSNTKRAVSFVGPRARLLLRTEAQSGLKVPSRHCFSVKCAVTPVAFL
jgi:hypothetical protein